MTQVGNALCLLPPAGGQAAVRAALMAMNVLPSDVSPDRAGLQQLRTTLGQQAHAVAIVDIAAMKPALAHLLALAAFIQDPLVRKRVILTRHADGPVWDSERNWVKGLGFADLVAGLDASSLVAESRRLLIQVAAITGADAISADTLNRYFSAMQVRPDTQTPRGLIRKATGLSAEALATALASSAKALSRVHHLTAYPACFIGAEAVSWLASQYSMTRQKAVALGQALQALALTHHVVHEQPFSDGNFFYRTTVSSAADRLHPGAVLQSMTLASGVPVQDRSYRASNYPACFVGAQAVDWVHTHHKVRRHDAEIFLNRLHGFGLIHHVAHAHPVRDGHFFYRFAH
jgi:hypothetical protein